jgi:hypothetical protein
VISLRKKCCSPKTFMQARWDQSLWVAQGIHQGGNQCSAKPAGCSSQEGTRVCIVSLLVASKHKASCAPSPEPPPVSHAGIGYETAKSLCQKVCRVYHYICKMLATTHAQIPTSQLGNTSEQCILNSYIPSVRDMT